MFYCKFNQGDCVYIPISVWKEHQNWNNIVIFPKNVFSKKKKQKQVLIISHKTQSQISWIAYKSNIAHVSLTESICVYYEHLFKEI